jgi:Nif-specific regulatory protein
VLERVRPLDLPGLAAEAAAVAVAVVESLDGPDADDFRSAGEQQLELAAERIGSAELRQGFLENPVFRALRKPPGVTPAMGQRLSTLYEMSRALNSASDPELLLASILDMALRVVKAERGMILLRGLDGEFAVRVARNLEQETIRDAERFSRSVALEAGAGKSVLAVDAEHDARIRDFKSVSLYGIRSVLCAPLRSRGRIIGAVYVDSRAQGSLFDRDDLRFLEAFADHAALALENARIREGLERENLRLQELAESRARFGKLIGDSASMRRVFELIEKVAVSQLPVLIRGESGTGKELAARAIHFNGPRCKAPFVSENCAAIPDTLLQSELFGHVRGAFTGAERDRAGLFEQADGGTLFLDEIGDTSPSMQALLLRVLQEGEVRRVGGDRPRTVDVRVIAATHRRLSEWVEKGLFREDLLYRLEVLTIDLPPLREREGDVALLVAHFLQRIARERGRKVATLEPAALDALGGHSWPGNVRQLENVLQRLTLNAGEGTITRPMLDDDPGFGGSVRVVEEGSTNLSLERSERERIGAALRASGGNRAQAARMLGISRATIYRKIRDYRL